MHKYSSRPTPHVRKVATKPETRTHGRKVPVCSRSSPPLAALVPPTAYELIQARASNLSIATTSIVPPTLEARGAEYCKAPVCSGFERVPVASLRTRSTTMHLNEVVLCATAPSASGTGPGALSLHDIQTGTSLASWKQTSAGLHCTAAVYTRDGQGGFMLAAQQDKSIMNVYTYRKV